MRKKVKRDTIFDGKNSTFQLNAKEKKKKRTKWEKVTNSAFTDLFRVKTLKKIQMQPLKSFLNLTQVV